MPGAFSVTSESFQLQILFQFFTVVPIILTTMACTRNGGVLSNINKKKKKRRTKTIEVNTITWIFQFPAALFVPHPS